MSNRNFLSPHRLFALVMGSWALMGCAPTAPPVTDLPYVALNAPPTATQTLRPAPPSEGPESKMTPSHAASAAPNTTYTNEYYNFAVDYPNDVEVSAQSDGPFQLIVYTDPENPFYIRATRDFLPGDVAYFLDTSPITETTYGAYVWQTYHLPNGYGDAVGFSPPIYALQMQAGDVLYTIVFFNQDSVTELQAHILSTFRVLNNPTPAPAMSVPTTVRSIAVPTPTVFAPGFGESPNLRSADLSRRPKWHATDDGESGDV